VRLFRRRIDNLPGGALDIIPSRDGGALVRVTKGRSVLDEASLGHNQFHAVIVRGPSGQFGDPGAVEDLGVSHNLRTNVGLDWQAHAMGGRLGILGGTSTGVTATTLTDSGAAFGTSGHEGKWVITAGTAGMIVSHTATVLTIDAWIKGDYSAASTPGTGVYTILPGQGPAPYIGLTTNVGAPAAGDTVLTGEITSGGLARARATFAHTLAATTYTLTHTFTSTATHTAVHKGGMFTASSTTAGGILTFTTNLNADATLASGDALTVTWTVTL
jgi:hypothetical protein